MLEDITSQLDTQPLEDFFEMEEGVGPHRGGLGTALPQWQLPQTCPEAGDVWLGRAKTSDYVIMESNMGSSKWPNAVTNCQCKIVKNSNGVFFRDKSSSGIWFILVSIQRSKGMWPK